jgi:hypothetical protein
MGRKAEIRGLGEPAALFVDHDRHLARSGVVFRVELTGELLLHLADVPVQVRAGQVVHVRGHVFHLRVGRPCQRRLDAT